MNTAILHYSTSPVVGGVEAVLDAHAKLFVEFGLPVTVIAGRGDKKSLPQGVNYLQVDEISSSCTEIEKTVNLLNSGKVPADFDNLVTNLENKLRPLLTQFDQLIVHNVFTKHFNLPLTAALFNLLDDHSIKHAIAWCHDLSWSSPNSRKYVHEGYPWELLKTPHKNITYVAISEERKKEIVRTFGLEPEKVPVIYNGVDARTILGLSDEGYNLVQKLDLWESDLNIIMPVRITTAKNIEFAMQVVAALKKMGCRVRLVLTGPPDPHDQQSLNYYHALLTMRHNLGIDDEMKFVYEVDSKGKIIDQKVVAELYRISDVLFLPSRREGFGMPILEAGLVGLPVFSTNIPATREIARREAYSFSRDSDPNILAGNILKTVRRKREYMLKVKVRKNYRWETIFENQILPLIKGELV